MPQEIMQFISAHFILILAWIILLIALIFIISNSYFSKIKEVSLSEATRLINKEGAIVVDSRNHDDFCKGHLVNSINLTPSEIKNLKLGNLEKYKTKPIILICTNSIASREPAENLYKLGFNKISILKGGIISWNCENLPLVPGK